MKLPGLEAVGAALSATGWTVATTLLVLAFAGPGAGHAAGAAEHPGANAAAVVNKPGERISLPGRGDPELEQSVLADLKNPDPAVRETAVRILAHLGGEKYAGSVRALLADPEWPVRFAACDFFRRFPDAAALRALRRNWDRVMTSVRKPSETLPPDEVLLEVNRLMDALYAARRLPAFAAVRAGFTRDLRAVASLKLDKFYIWISPSTGVPLNRKAALVLCRLGAGAPADYGLRPDECRLIPPDGAAAGTGAFRDEAGALAVFHRLSEEATRGEGQDGTADAYAWWDALAWMEAHPSAATDAVLLAWLRRNLAGPSGGAEAPDDARKDFRRHWGAVLDIFGKADAPAAAAALVRLWRECGDEKLAYDLAWRAARLGGLDALSKASEDVPEAWRRTQAALILYGRSEDLTLEQAGRVLAAKRLCRFQQLWLIQSVLRARQPSAEAVAAFLEQSGVEASPEILYEVRRCAGGWVDGQVRRVLESGPEADRVRLLGLLPDFDLPDSPALLAARLDDPSGRVRAEARSALRRGFPAVLLRLDAAEAERSGAGLRVVRVFQPWTGFLEAFRTLPLCDPEPAGDAEASDAAGLAFSGETKPSEWVWLARWFDAWREARDAGALPLAEAVVREGRDTLATVAAVRYLGETGGPETRTLILPLLDHPYPDLRTAVIEALGRVATAEDIPRLKPFLEWPDANPPFVDLCRRLSRTDLLFDAVAPQVHCMLQNGRFPERTLNALIAVDRERTLRIIQESLASREMMERWEAVQFLAKAPLRDPSSVDLLVRMLGDPEHVVRIMAAGALGVLRDSRAVAPLRSLLEMPGSDEDLRANVKDALVAIDPHGTLIDRQTSFETQDDSYLSAVFLLGQTRGPDAALARMRLLKLYLGSVDDNQEDHDFLRMIVAGALVKLGDPEAVKVLLERARDRSGKDWEAYLQAFLALYPMGNLPDGGASVLRPFLGDRGNPAARLVASLRLALGGDAAAAADLLDQLSSDTRRDEFGQFLAAFEVLTLGTTQTPGTAETLINLVNQGEANRAYNWVGGAAVMALGDLGDRRALPALRRARLSPDPLLAFYAGGAMYKLADEAWALDLLGSRQPALVRAGIFASERFPSAAVTAALREHLRHPDWRVRGYAAFALGRRPVTPGDGAVEADLEAVAADDPSGRVRDEAAAALRHRANPGVFEETCFEAGLLLEWLGKAETRMDLFFRADRLQERVPPDDPDRGWVLSHALREVARGKVFLDTEYITRPDDYFLTEFTERAFALHLLGAARLRGAFELTRDWVGDGFLEGTMYEEAVYGAVGILLGELRDPRGEEILRAMKGKSREWLVQALLDLGLRKIAGGGGMETGSAG
ncbi:MAG: HEAT repeat domain-containing protein [Acidobacteria bacterium]|nr:HEAT repeat domain-containing protein [Acidobacteriota bacterium]